MVIGCEEGKVILLLDDGTELKRKCNPACQQELLELSLETLNIMLLNEVIEMFHVEKGK